MTQTSKFGRPLLCASLLCAAAIAALAPHSAWSYAFRRLHLASSETAPPSPGDPTNRLPPVTLWAWERAEDFRFLSTGRTGVAFLAKAIYLQPQTPAVNSSGEQPASFIVRPRLQPLRITPGTPLMAVVRIEMAAGSQFKTIALPEKQATSASNSPVTPSHRNRLASEIAAMQTLPGVTAIQIDFDAPASEHSFYASLLQDVRARLPASFPLSITALASWCMGDPWLTRLPPGTIDEAVPMLFRMGPDTANVANFLQSGNEFPVASCQTSLGLSTDEPLSKELLSGKLSRSRSPWRGKRIYVFAPRAWSQSAAEKILKEWQP